MVHYANAMDWLAYYMRVRVMNTRERRSPLRRTTQASKEQRETSLDGPADFCLQKSINDEEKIGHIEQKEAIERYRERALSLK